MQERLAAIASCISVSRCLKYLDVLLLLVTWIIEASALPGVDTICSAAFDLALPLVQLAIAGSIPIWFFALYMHLTVGPSSLAWSTMSRAIARALEQFFIGACRLAHLRAGCLSVL